MRDQELRSRLQALALAGQADPTPAAIAAVRRRLRRKVQGGVAVALAGLLLAGVGVRLGSEAIHRRGGRPAPVVAPPAGPPAAVAPRTFVGQLGSGSARRSAIIDAATGRILREVPGSKRRTEMAADAVVSPDLRSMYLPDTGLGLNTACGSGWTRVDLATGASRPAFGGLSGVGQLSLSADGGSLAFVHLTPAGLFDGSSCHAELVVRALASGEQRVWTIPPGVSVEDVQLSPDATRLAYLLRLDPAQLQPTLHVLPLDGTTSVTQGRDLPATGGCPMSDPRFAGGGDRLLAIGTLGCASGALQYRLVGYDLRTGRVADSTPLALPGEIFSVDVDPSGRYVIVAGAGKPNDQQPATVWVLRDGHQRRVPFPGDCWQADW
jgi:dipeptidyl aminopeptidase/acylaminoacyl peptidase